MRRLCRGLFVLALVAVGATHASLLCTPSLPLGSSNSNHPRHSSSCSTSNTPNRPFCGSAYQIIPVAGLLPRPGRFLAHLQSQTLQQQHQHGIAPQGSLRGGNLKGTRTRQRLPTSLASVEPYKFSSTLEKRKAHILASTRPVGWRSLFGLKTPKLADRGLPRSARTGSSYNGSLLSAVLVRCLRLCRPVLVAAVQHKKPLLHSAAVSIKLFRLLLYVRTLLEWLPQANPHVPPFAFVYGATSMYTRIFSALLGSIYLEDLSGLCSSLCLESIENRILNHLQQP
ncbi:yggt family domain protein [Cyclospora cayetanensis]|uniref:Yggt family domain protein n=1 Tax=Cyclospora cayetanensis TaxID=88456 RepID=A0A1D3D7G5_9EIME|nr:yggt family domain protein [Cyclospora cayetanensis]